MTLCENYTFLIIFMYFKYIIISLFLISLICILYLKISNKDIFIYKKLVKILSIVITIYIILFLIFNTMDIKYKSCFINSSFNRINYYESLKVTEKSQNNSLNTFLDTIEPSTTVQAIGNDEMNVYNQNEYPASYYKYVLKPNYNDYIFKKSGNEIMTLSSILSGLNIGDDTNPIEILDILKNNGITNFDMNQILPILANEYDFEFRLITENEIYGGLKNGGLILAKVHGAPEDQIFTCTDSYIVVYAVDNEENYKILSVNDKNYNYICPENTKGFGNIVNKNINDSSYFLYNITDNADALYLLWR